MDFGWLEIPFDLRKVPPREIEETFSLRLLPELHSRNGSARYFNLGRTTSNRAIFSVFWTDGKRDRVILS